MTKGLHTYYTMMTIGLQKVYKHDITNDCKWVTQGLHKKYKHIAKGLHMGYKRITEEFQNDYKRIPE